MKMYFPLKRFETHMTKLHLHLGQRALPTLNQNMLRHFATSLGEESLSNLGIIW